MLSRIGHLKEFGKELDEDIHFIQILPTEEFFRRFNTFEKKWIEFDAVCNIIDELFQLYVEGSNHGFCRDKYIMNRKFYAQMVG